MSIFGWSLPPGCGSLPGEEPDPPCECCGKGIDDCICPTCPTCGLIGDPNCYREHGLVMSQEQIDSLQYENARMEEDNNNAYYPE